MVKAPQAAITVMQNAAASAPVGQRREAALDALNAWIGSSIRIKIAQDNRECFVATHASGMTRVGEQLRLPSTGWTVEKHEAMTRSDFPVILAIERSTDSTYYLRTTLTSPPSINLSADLDGVTPPTIQARIGALNIDDPEPAGPPGPVAGAPTSYLYKIYDNPAAPVSVSQSLVGMHFHDKNHVASPGYAYDCFRTHDCTGCFWGDIETADGVYDWSAADTAINAAYNAGRRVLFTVFGTPLWAGAFAHPNPYDSNPARARFVTAPADWGKLTRFVDKVMERYAGKLWAVQWWNEPDLSFTDYYTQAGTHNDWWIGTVAGNSSANKAQRRVDYARGQKLVFDAVKARDPSVLVFLGGFVYWDSALTGVHTQVTQIGSTAWAGVEARAAADVLGFHYYGDDKSSQTLLNRFRCLAATRSAMRGDLKIAIDELGAWDPGHTFNTNDHIRHLERALLMGAGFGVQVIGLYSHEDLDYLGDPSSTPAIRASIDNMRNALRGKRMIRAYVLNDQSVWLAFDDGSTVQSAGGVPPDVEAPDPDPGDLTVGDRILWLGDSTVYGHNSIDGNQVAQPVSAVLQAALDNDYPVDHEGVGSTTTSDLLAGTGGFSGTLDAILAANPYAKIVIVTFGINDSYMISQATFASNLRSIVAKIRAAGKIPVLETPNPTIQDLTTAVATIRSIAAETSTLLIDQYDYITAQLGGSAVTTMMPDGYHPSQATYIIKGQYAATKLRGWFDIDVPAPPGPPTSWVDRPFRADSPWNTKIPTSAIYRIDNRTNRIRSQIGGPSDRDEGAIVWALNVTGYTINTFYDTPGGPTGTFVGGGMNVPIPLPAAAQPSPGTDGHMCIVDRDGVHSHDFIFISRSGSTINGGGYMKTRLDGMGWRLAEESRVTGGNPHGINPDNCVTGNGGPRAVSVGLLGGLIRKRHLDDGVIPHALAFAIPRRWAKGGINVRIYPADFILGWGDSDNGMPPYFSGDIRYSDRFGLDRSVNVNSLGLSREWTIVAKALQDYGMYMVDVAGPQNPCLYMETPDGYSIGMTMRNTQTQAFNAIIPRMFALDWY